MANSAAGGSGDYNTKVIEEFRVNQRRVGRMWEGHHAHSHPPHRCQLRDRGRRAGGLLPSARPPLRDLCRQRRIADPTRTGATTTTTVEAGTQTFTVLAQELGGTARAELTKELPVPKRGWRRS